MTIKGPPPTYYFEDRTGHLESDWDEVYERCFLRVSATPQRTPNASLMVYDMAQRSTAQGDRDRRHYYREPVVTLDFGPRGALGTVHFKKGIPSVPMHQYLRKVSYFGRSLNRQFRALDGNVYRWNHRMEPGHEWTCVDAEGSVLVARYTLKPADRPAYGVSGNVLAVFEPYAPLSAEILASLTIMRHIAQNNL